MSKTVRAGSKELRALARRLPAGIRLISDGKSKCVLTRDDGSVVRYEDGRPVSFPNSPSPASVKTLIHRLELMGLIR